MRNYRGLTKDGKWVHGYYIKHCGSYILQDFTLHDKYYVEVIPETVSEEVCEDKNGDKVFAGDWIEGNLFDRRIPTMGKIVYDTEHACYGSKNDAGITFLFKIAEIELIKDTDNE